MAAAAMALPPRRPRSVRNGTSRAEATSASGAVVNFALPAATDLADPNPTVVASPSSGTTFALGQTIVTVTATDASGNSSELTFTVTVEDTTPPDLTVPDDVTAEPHGNLTLVDIGVATATDLVTPSNEITITNDAPAEFEKGVTLVTWSATDAAGNTATATQVVNVVKLKGDGALDVADVSPPEASATGPEGAGSLW